MSPNDQDRASAGRAQTYLVIFAAFGGAGSFQVPDEEAARDLAVALAPVHGMQSILIGRYAGRAVDGMPLITHPEKVDIGYLTGQNAPPESMH